MTPTPDLVETVARAMGVVLYGNDERSYRATSGRWDLCQKLAQAALLAIPDPNPSGQWRDIASAPKNGTRVLLFLNPPVDTNDLCGWVPTMNLEIVVGWAEDFGSYVDQDYGHWRAGLCADGSADTEGYSSALQVDVHPTHWMPLPAPPPDTDEQGELDGGDHV